jgi:hypothetical protein
MRAEQYLQQARQMNSRRYRNFVDDYRGFIQQPAYPFIQQPAFQNQTGVAAQAQTQDVKPSMPYSIIVSSASGAAVQNFDIFGASEYLNNPNVTFNSNGDLVNGSVTISANTPNITYRDLLYQSITANFSVGEVYLQCSSPTNQITQPYTIFTKDGNGLRVQIPIKPKKDPYQQQTDVLIDNTVFRMDSMTKITFSQILAGAVLYLDLYPSDNVNAGRLINGQNPTKFYGNPGNIRSSIAVVPGSGGGNFSGPTMIRSRM